MADEELADEEDGTSLLLAVNSSGQVRTAFFPLTTTRLAPDLLLLAAWSACIIIESTPLLLSSSAMKERKKSVSQ